MSEQNGNGVLQIGRKGRKKFAFGDGAPFEVDIIRVQNEWVARDAEMRDDKGELLPEYRGRWVEELARFVGAIAACEVTDAEALEFRKLVWDEAEKLKVFFEIKSPARPDSAGSSELVFSQ